MTKIRKARKKHSCNKCHKSIRIGEYYSYIRKVVECDDGIFSYELKTCEKCDSPRGLYKQKKHEERAIKRMQNCPDSNFEYVWQGGWDIQLGCPDGGDVQLECHNCNLHCKK